MQQQQKKNGIQLGPNMLPSDLFKFQKTLHVKCSGLVSIWKIPIFFISMSQKIYLTHLHE